jgi:type I restriction enzyme S subunit
VKLKEYLQYKKTDSDWLEEIPSHWDMYPNRAIFVERIQKGFSDEQLLSVTIQKGVIKQSDLLKNSIKKDSSNEDKSNYKLLLAGDIAYNKMRMWQGAAGVSKYRGIVSPAYIILSPRMKVNTWYYHLLFRTPEYMNESHRYSYGICDDQLSLRFRDFKVIFSPVPPEEEQNIIVKYLLSKIRGIEKIFVVNEKLVGVSKSVAERKESLIELYKTRLISDVVTGKYDVREMNVEDVTDKELAEDLALSEEIEKFEDMVEEVPDED